MRLFPAAALAFLSITCSGGPPAPTAAPLPPASLPDLSRMEPPVQQQITGDYQALQALIAKSGTPPSDLARAYGSVGSLLLAANAKDAAESFYLRAESLAPDEVRWPYYLGHVYMAKADATRAAAAFDRARRLQPMDVATLVWLGKVNLDRNQPESAEPLFTQALSIQPRTVAALYGLGRTALARRDYTRAVERLEQVLAADPRASAAHYPLALAYRELGDTAKADAHLRQRGDVEIGPPDPLMVELRGLLHGAAAEEERGMRALDNRDFTAAAEHFRKGLEYAPDNPAIRHKLGTALAQLGDARGASEAFEETLRRAPHFAQAHYSLGILALSSGRTMDAEQHLSNAIRDEPSYVEARLQLGEIYGRTGRFDRALEQFRRAMELDPRVPEARFGYAGALVGLRRTREAREALSEGATLFPGDPRFAEALSRVESGARRK
jgi:tetratricopeptide (TPR) repeat protein